MGTCHSICIKDGELGLKEVMVGVSKDNNRKHTILLSPVASETTKVLTPISQDEFSLTPDMSIEANKRKSIASSNHQTFCIPEFAAMSLTSMINETTVREKHLATPSLQEKRNLDSVILEEEDGEAPSDEDDSFPADYEQQKTQDRVSAYKPSIAHTTTTKSTQAFFKPPDQPADEQMSPDLKAVKMRSKFMAKTGPDSIVHHPPRIVPPSAEGKPAVETRDAVESHAMVEFSKLKVQVQLAKKHQKEKRRVAKIEERAADVRGYRNLWKGYKAMQKDLSKKSQGDTNKEEEAEINNEKQQPDKTPPEGNPNERHNFDLKSTENWFFDFRHINRNKEQQDDTNSRSGLSLHSEFSMEAQRRLFAEKRRQRLSKEHEAQHKLATDGDSVTPTKQPQSASTPSTPRLSPPSLQVYTAEKVTKTTSHRDYGPQRRTSNSSITNMEVSFTRQTDGDGNEMPFALSRVSSFGDDGSMPTIDIDCYNDYKVARRRRRGRSPGSKSHADETSLESNGSRLGSPSAKNTKDIVNGENKMQGIFLECMFNQCDRTSRELHALKSSNEEAQALRQRIANLEKKFGITNQPGTDPKVAVQPIREVMDLIASPVATQTPLQPAQLDSMFSRQDRENSSTQPMNESRTEAMIEARHTCGPSAQSLTPEVSKSNLTPIEQSSLQHKSTKAFEKLPTTLETDFIRSDRGQGQTELKENIVMLNALKCVQNCSTSVDSKQERAHDATKNAQSSKSKVATDENALCSTISHMSTDEFLKISDDHALVQVVRLQNGTYVVRRSTPLGRAATTESEGSEASLKGIDASENSIKSERFQQMNPSASFEKVAEMTKSPLTLANDIENEVNALLSKFRNNSEAAKDRQANTLDKEEITNKKLSQTPSYREYIAKDEIFEIQVEDGDVGRLQ